MSETLFGRIGNFLHRRRPWYQLPGILAVPKLVEMRNDLRQKNLHDTEEPPLQKQATPDPNPKLRQERTIDGTHNDLHYPRMGCAGTRSGGIVRSNTHPDKNHLLDPNPRVVSRELMTRGEFQPATILNMMAASWIEFMVHDWSRPAGPRDAVGIRNL